MKKTIKFTAAVSAVLYAFFLIFYLKDVCAAVMQSLKVCMEVIIPSLYAFMVVSGFIVSSGVYALLSKPFGLIARYVFRIPEEYFSIFLIGSVGGYPVGARLLADMTASGRMSRADGERMLSYCYLAGPAFICGSAGITLFSDVKTGMLIFLSILSANVIIAVISGFGRPVPRKSRTPVRLNISAECLIKSIYDGAKGMFSICAVIVFFSSIICILDKLGFIRFAAAALSKLSALSYEDSTAAVKTFIEISNITTFGKNNFDLVPLAAALLSFGGLCVIMQTEGFVVRKLSTKRFYFGRLSAMPLSYFLCKILTEAFSVKTISVIAPEGLAYRQNSLIPVIFLLIMTILLLLNISIEKR